MNDDPIKKLRGFLSFDCGLNSSHAATLMAHYDALLAERDALAGQLANERAHSRHLSERLHELTQYMEEAQAQLAQARAEIVSVGWQYKFHGYGGDFVWRNSQQDYNGSRCIGSREIFARREPPSAGGQQT